ncbi:hypothetical protein ACOJBM_43205 [Rhizobium beringeri]
MATVMWTSDRAVLKVDSVFCRASYKCLAMELPAIVQMDDVRQTEDRPFCLNVARSQPAVLRQYHLLDRQGDGCRRRAFQTEKEPGHHPARHINSQRQPRSLKGLPAHSVNDEEVDKGVIYLNDLERILGRIFADHWPE